MSVQRRLSAVLSDLSTPCVPTCWTTMRGLMLVGLVLLWTATGCGGDTRYEDRGMVVTASTPPVPAASPAEAPSREAAPAANPSGGEVPPAMPRRVIYNGQVTLVVENLSKLAQEIERLVRESGGYISETNMETQSREHRIGTWKVRVPVDRFDGFLSAIGKQGELQQTHVDSQDVSQEYYDLEARITSKQQEEKRLLKHLEESTAKLEDILAVERELSRVRTEIEQMQGRHRYLTSQTSFSTVTISASEVRDYTPPVSPTLATEVSRTFQSSVQGLASFGRGVLLFVVALSPWIPLIALLALLLWWVGRRLGFRQAPTSHRVESR